MWTTQACGPLLPRPHQNCTFIAMPQRNNVQKPSNENQIQLALQAIRQDVTITPRRAAAIHTFSRSTLTRRLAGKPSRRDYRPAVIRLTATEEAVVLQRALDFDERGSSLQLAAVKDMADCLLAQRQEGPVSKHWANNFVQRQPELQVKFNRKYDYSRALCEDPEIIQDWFRLVENTKAKHSILNKDTYNFDETGFMMGIITARAVVTSSERQGGTHRFCSFSSMNHQSSSSHSCTDHNLSASRQLSKILN